MSVQKKNGILGIYLQEIAQYPLLNHRQTLELAKLVEKGSDASNEARNKLVKSNLRLVVSIAKKYARRHHASLLDLIQEGVLGLFRAIDLFDWRRGVKLSTYATYWIKQYIQVSLAYQDRTIRIPIHVMEMLSKYQMVKTQLKVELGAEPTIHEIAFTMNLTIRQVKNIIKAAASKTFLEAAFSKESVTFLGDMLPDEREQTPFEASVSKALPDVLEKVSKGLTKLEWEVICLRYGLKDGNSCTLEEVGDRIGKTRERVRQIQKAALEKLKNNQTIIGLQ